MYGEGWQVCCCPTLPPLDKVWVVSFAGRERGSEPGGGEARLNAPSRKTLLTKHTSREHLMIMGLIGWPVGQTCCSCLCTCFNRSCPQKVMNLRSDLDPTPPHSIPDLPLNKLQATPQSPHIPGSHPQHLSSQFKSSCETIKYPILNSGTQTLTPVLCQSPRIPSVLCPNTCPLQFESAADLVPSQASQLSAEERRRRARDRPDPRLILTRTNKLAYHIAARAHRSEVGRHTRPTRLTFSSSASQ